MFSADLPYLQGMGNAEAAPQAVFARHPRLNVDGLREAQDQTHRLLTIYPVTFARLYNTVGEARITIGGVIIDLRNDGNNIILLNIIEGAHEANMRMGLDTSRIMLNGVKILPSSAVNPADMLLIQRAEILINGYIQGYIDRDKTHKRKCSCVLL